MATNLSIRVLVRNRERIFFNDKASSVSSFNDRGPFDVLPQHANFLSLISKAVIIDKGLPTEKFINTDSGVLNASRDVVKVYLGL